MLKKLIKLFNRKTTLEQQLKQCEYLDQLQNKQMEGLKLV